jgi:hypothetical protein
VKRGAGVQECQGARCDVQESARSGRSLASVWRARAIGGQSSRTTRFHCSKSRARDKGRAIDLPSWFGQPDSERRGLAPPKLGRHQPSEGRACRAEARVMTASEGGW